MKSITYFITILFITTFLFALLPEEHLESKVLTSAYSNEYDGYYVNLTDVADTELHFELHEIIKNHTAAYYVDTWGHLEEIDYSTNNPDNINLFYTGRSHPSNDSDWDGNPIRSNDSWNREHVWPRSHGDFGTERSKAAGTDLHNLRPTDKSVNYDRWDKDFDYAEIQHDECTECYYSHNYWEPPNAVKGDVARTLFYMDVRYSGELDEPDLSLFNGYTHGTVGVGTLGKLCTMYQWNVDDPVDSRELERNIAIFEIQGNRNPFIDYPNFVMDIWGEDCDSNFDNDELWGIEDPDDDNDGVDDNNDSCLRTNTNVSVDENGCGLYELDSDGDGYTDDVDAFINDISQWADSDGDGFEDGSDEFINNPTQWADADGDGFGDNLAHPTITIHSIEQCRATITTQIQSGNMHYERGSDAILCVIYGAENNHIALQDEEYRCNDGDMIPIRWVNDGDDDCGDMSDEDVTMKVSEFKPASRYYHFSDYDIGWAIPSATNGDDCPLESGTSIHDRKGCLDSDGDGWSDATEDWKIEDGADAFPKDKTQYIDSDGDGFGDDENGGTDLADAFPSNPTQWKDTDGDGWGDNQDPAASKVDSHINESSQWADRDRDGFGDNISGVNGDFCPDAYGASIVDRYGCPDSDSDGYSDMNGFFATTTDKAGNGDTGAILTLSVVPFLLIIILVMFQFSRKNKGRELDRGNIQEAMQDAVAWGIEEATYQSATATTPAPAPIQSSPPPAKVEQGASSWVEQYDNQGNMYYFNQDTQESSWDTPQE